ncbi:hypothetical protein CBS147321_10999 [Aspergillus niger]|nr:hypothetical protein CBS12448_10883 [Aspergillus niger]KAI2868832.1 hypothetical protein CBS11852_11304 [Aspergillus niger]KAI2928637.1 hypothetical protein CBS147321_10999 [Aspergillus niger]KAI2937280.1 hypothetical protein CBS147322_10908 [Aspergillus niger]KAI2989170.1 hypothetical protein CBS147345_10637 [Aspergillus niger]
MGINISKQVAEEVIRACESTDNSGRIDSILFDKPEFQRLLSELWREIPSDVQKSIQDSRTIRKKAMHYGDKDITEHRSFKTLLAASRPHLSDVARETLLSGYEDPQSFLRSMEGIKDCQDVQMNVDSYLNFVRRLGQTRERDTIRWRLGLIPLSEFASKFTNKLITAEKYDEIAHQLVCSGLIIHNREEIRKDLPSWISASKRYRRIAQSLGGAGYICCLPTEPSDYLWQKHLPIEGPVHDACMKLLSDTGIHDAASEIIKKDHDTSISANMAAEKILKDISSYLSSTSFSNTFQGAFDVLVTAATTISRQISESPSSEKSRSNLNATTPRQRNKRIRSQPVTVSKRQRANLARRSQGHYASNLPAVSNSQNDKQRSCESEEFQNVELGNNASLNDPHSNQALPLPLPSKQVPVAAEKIYTVQSIQHGQENLTSETPSNISHTEYIPSQEDQLVPSPCTYTDPATSVTSVPTLLQNKQPFPWLGAENDKSNHGYDQLPGNDGNSNINRVLEWGKDFTPPLDWERDFSLPWLDWEREFDLQWAQMEQGSTQS